MKTVLQGWWNKNDLIFLTSCYTISLTLLPLKSYYNLQNATSEYTLWDCINMETIPVSSSLYSNVNEIL